MRNSLSFLPLASGFLVLVLSLGVAVLTINSKNNSSQNLNTKASEQIPSLGLSPATSTYAYSPNQTYTVGIIIDSAGKLVSGVDIIINFDPTKAQVIDPKITPANLFEQYPLNSVDNVKGKIRIGALSFNAKPVTGIIGTFKFKSLIKGEVNFSFDYTPGATTDTNIAEQGTATDILGKVDNGSYRFE